MVQKSLSHCISCNNLIPERDNYPFSGHKKDCELANEWIKNREDLEFLKQLSHELKTQDNAITANPIFIVQDMHRLWGLWDDGGDGYIYAIKGDPEYFFYSKKEAEEFILKENNEVTIDDDDFDEIFDTWEYIDQWKYKTAHLTRKAAESYIEKNKHNLVKPRIWVDSQYRCHEFNRLIEIIKENF